MKPNKKALSLVFGVLGLAVFLFSTENKAFALEPGRVQLDDDFGQKIAPYILSQPVVAGPFTGGKEADMEEILPFYTSPLTRYDFLVTTANQKQSFKPGEKITLNGRIGYSFNVGESQKALDGLKGCKEGCPNSGVYRFPVLPEVGVFVQVWRKDEDKAQSLEGDYLVDEFYAAENINLAENVSKEFSTDWQTPAGLKDGNYYFFFYVNSAKRFTLDGSPLVAFNQAAVYNFRITNTENSNGLEIDKNDISINGKSYIYRQPAPEIQPENGKITVAVPLSNLSPETREAKITYQLFGWGQEDPADLVDAKQVSKTIGAGEKSNLEYTFSPPETGSLYSLKIRATNATSVSTANIRFVVKDQARGIFRYLGQALDGAGNLQPVFCLRNAAWAGLFHGKVKITAFDKNNKLLGAFEKEGSMRSEDRCFAIGNREWLKGGNIAKLA